MKYKIGDKVRIVSKKTGVCWNSEGKMDKWLGKVMTIRDTLPGGIYSMKEDDGEFYGDGWCWHEEMIEGLAPEQPKQKVVITTDGKTTLARLYDGKKVIKRAEAKCSPDDKFDFNVGAELAFSRLMGKEAPEFKYKAGDKVVVIANTCHHGAKVGQVITLTDNNVGGWGKDHWHYKENSGYIWERDFAPYVEPSKPEVYNGKVVCIKTAYPWWTVGKVYEVKDGIITADNGYQYPKLDNYRYKDAEDVRHAGCTKGKNYNHKNEFIPLVED